MIKSKTYFTFCKVCIAPVILQQSCPCRHPRGILIDFYALTQGTNNLCPMPYPGSYSLYYKTCQLSKGSDRTFLTQLIDSHRQFFIYVRFPVDGGVMLHIDWCISNGVDYCRIKHDGMPKYTMYMKRMDMGIPNNYKLLHESVDMLVDCIRIIWQYVLL